MKRQSLPALVVVIAVLVVGIAGLVSAQGVRGAAAPADDPLLAEVRALRAELAQAAAVSIRSQLLVARLQVQEQRVAGLGRQLIDVDTQLAEVSREMQEIAGRIAQFSGLTMPAEEQKAFDALRGELKRRLGELQQREQQLRGQQADVSNAVSAEQGRWIDFNNRLDEIERSLPAGR